MHKKSKNELENDLHILASLVKEIGLAPLIHERHVRAETDGRRAAGVDPPGMADPIRPAAAIPYITYW